jgi:hypothetical protein
MSSSRPSTAFRVVSVGASAIAAIASLALLALGGVSLWGISQKDHEGYINTHREPITTTSYALTTDDMTIDTGAPSWVIDDGDFGKVRLSAQSRDGKPVFVGIARTSDVKRYLAGTAHSTVTDFNTSPFEVTYDEHQGTRRPVPPAESSIWTASVHGTGTQRLNWDVTDGSWSVVVMNADGSRNVDTTVSAGAKLPFLSALGWGSLGGGMLLMLAAGGMLYLGVRPPRTPPSHTAVTPVAA